MNDKRKKPYQFWIGIRVSKLLMLMLAVANAHGYAQITINGPTCVVAGTTYQYTITGTWDSLSTMNVCITNGRIADSSDSACTPLGAPVATVLVHWNDSVSSAGSITVTSSVGSATFSVSFTDPLLPGSIDTASKTQFIGIDSVPAIIHCAVDSGGACSPVYSYQWQQSSDMVSWANMTGATSQDLQIDTSLKQSTYYRRKVMETNSGTVGYSDVATVFVGITFSRDKWRMQAIYCYSDIKDKLTAMPNRYLNSTNLSR